MTPCRVARVAIPVAAVALAACGSSPSPAPTAAPSPTATPSPPPPDKLAVDVAAQGIGSYLLTTVPVAVVHNAAAGHAAVDVHVAFTVVDTAGRTVDTAAADIATIAPGETTAVSARLELRAAAYRTRTAVTVRSWTPASPGQGVITAGAAAYACGTPSCTGYGTVTGSLGRPSGLPASMTVTAACSDAGGAIVGGGSSTVAGHAAGQSVGVAVIVGVRPAGCALYASAGL